MDTPRNTAYGVYLGILPLAIPFMLQTLAHFPEARGHAPHRERPEALGAAPPPARIAPDLVPLAEILPAGEGRALTLTRLAGYGPLLRFLPLADLVGVEPDAAGLELEFDFAGRGSRRVELPGCERWVLESSSGDWLRHGRALQVRGEDRTLIVHRRVRLHWDETGITGVRDGDLELAYGLFAPNVALSTERRSAEVRDEHGRLVLELDEAGVPRREDGCWVPLRADSWLVLEVKGRRFELPLAR